MRFILPFIDPDTDKGFYINSANIAFIAFIGILGNIGSELMNCIIINNLKIGADVVSHALEQMDNDLKLGRKYDVVMKLKIRSDLDK